MIEKVNTVLNGIVWGIPGMVLILGIGLYLSFRLKFIQLTKFKYAMKNTIGKVFNKKDKNKADGVSPFGAVCTALSATIGTGNIAGVAGAITVGGPGAIFWMWISALVGMVTKFSEVVLSVNFREKNENGEYVGGPMYSIKNGLSKNWRFLAITFAILCVFASFGIGNAVQANTITSSIGSVLSNYNITYNASVFKIIIGIVLMLLVGIIMIGGVKRLVSVTEKLVPAMAITYILLGFGVVVLNYKYIIPAFISIFKGAFNPTAVTGGIVGSIIMTMRKGVSRGIFSNEAGLGSASIAHSTTSEKNPVKQGLWGIFEVFADTIVICTLTALVILCGTHGLISYEVEQGVELTLSGFTLTYGTWSGIIVTLTLCCFAFSTIIGWGYYGAKSIEFLLGKKSIKPYMLVFSFMCILGATANLGLVWNISDTLNGLMMIPNLISVILLSPIVFKLTKKYFSKKNLN